MSIQPLYRLKSRCDSISCPYRPLDAIKAQSHLCKHKSVRDARGNIDFGKCNHPERDGGRFCSERIFNPDYCDYDEMYACEGDSLGWCRRDMERMVRMTIMSGKDNEPIIECTPMPVDEEKYPIPGHAKIIEEECPVTITNPLEKIYPSVRQGWQCPVCKRVYAPNTPMCLKCPDGQKTESKSTGKNSDIHKPDIVCEVGNEQKI